MTEVAGDTALAAQRSDDARLIAGVSAAHFVSHFYMLVLPPLFAFVKADYAVSYTEIGLALTVFNTVSAVLQTPAGFLIDRINPRLALVIGLALGAIGYAVAALVDSYWMLIAMFGLLGVGNTVYHPADYVLLSRHIAPERMAHAYSMHSFAGMLGTAAAPATALFLHEMLGWRGAFAGAAVIGFAATLLLLLQPNGRERPATGNPRDTTAPLSDWRLLLAAPILVNLVFFVVYAFAVFGLQNYFVVVMDQLYRTPDAVVNSALSAYLLLTAAGVLLGGWIVRGGRHRQIAALGLAASVVTTLLIGTVDLGALLLVGVMSLAGLCSGLVMPSRDLIVRAIVPPGAFGRVFAFLTTGYHVAGILAPLLFGALLDHGAPRAVFIISAAFMACAVIAVLCVPPRRPAP
jgi:MFS family permease